ncbi:MAG: endonuclease/exonuclease/phosphatase family protein [Candidatus Tectimicrobiota bacterium]
MLAIVVALLIILLLAGVLLWAGGGKTLHEPHGSGIVETVPGALETSPAPAEELSILSYNIAYGLGDTTSLPADAVTVYDRLDHIIETIAACGADLVLLQEVDFASRRTHGVDQLQYIAAALGWGFVARVITWECRYLPLPLWPPRHHAGRLRAGQGVISRYPLVQNTRQRLSQATTQPLLTPLFAPYRIAQMVDVQCSQRPLRVINVHLEPGDIPTRQRQAHELAAFARQVATPNSVLMGTFNGVIAAATPSHDQTMEVITSSLRDRLRLVPDSLPTYPADEPRDRLDHVFVGPGLQVLETRVIALEAPSAAHLPLLVRLRWTLPLAPPNGSHTHANA